MKREDVEKKRELEDSIAEQSRKSLIIASNQDHGTGTSETSSIKMKETENKEFKTPGENYQKNADRIQISSGGKSKSEAMKKFEEKKERLKDKTEVKMKEMSKFQSKVLNRGR